MLCFGVHPYEDSAKLRIINANYQIPEDDKQYTLFHDLISTANFALVLHAVLMVLPMLMFKIHALG